MHNKKARIFTAFTANVLSRAIGTVVTYLAGILVMRLLPVRGFGELSLFLGFISFFSGLGLGIQHVFQRYIAVYAEDRSDFPRAVKFTITAAFLRLAVFFSLLLCVYLLKASNVIGTSRFDFPYIFLAVVVCSGVICRFVLQDGLLSAFLDQKFYYSIETSLSALKALLIFALRPGNVSTYVYIWLAFEAVNVAALLCRYSFLLSANKRGASKITDRPMEFKRYFAYGKYFLIASASSQILGFDFDKFFLAYFTGNEAVGLYSFAAMSAFALVSFAPANLLFSIATPMMIKEFSVHGDKSRFREAVGVLFKLNVTVYAAMAFFLALNAKFIISALFGQKYMPALPYFYSFIMISFFPVIKNTFEPLARGIEKSRVYLYVFFAAAVNIAGNMLLIPRLGVWGAVISTGSSMFIQAMAFAVFANKEVQFCLDARFARRIAMNMSLLVLTGYMLFPRIQAGASGVAAANIILGIIFIMLFGLNRCFTVRELEFIRSFIPGRALMGRRV